MGSRHLGYGALCRGLLLRTHAPRNEVRRRRSAPQVTRVSGRRVSRIISLRSSGSSGWRIQRYGKRVIDLAVRWVLDQGITTALWGARHPEQLDPARRRGWSLDAAAKAEIDRIIGGIRSPIRLAPVPWPRRNTRRPWSSSDETRRANARAFRHVSVIVDVDHRPLPFRQNGRTFSVVYEKTDDNQLIASSFSARKPQDEKRKVSFPQFLALAWTAANAKAKEIGWIA